MIICSKPPSSQFQLPLLLIFPFSLNISKSIDINALGHVNVRSNERFLFLSFREEIVFVCVCVCGAYEIVYLFDLQIVKCLNDV